VKRDKCVKVAAELLGAKQSVAVDNTNADENVRAYWVSLAKRFSVPIRCVHFTSPPELCRHNDAVRALNTGTKHNPENRIKLPGVAFADFARRFKEPTLEEGFEDIFQVPFVFKGSEEERVVWSRYWV
jgi:bifunctional polynucleotide phosphatase/kinase